MATTRTIPDNKNKAGSRPAPPPLKTPDQAAPKNQQVAIIAPPRILMPPAISKEFGTTDSEWRVLVEATFPSARSAESIAMVLAYCRQRKLDVFKRPCHIVPIYSTAKKGYIETVWPGIAEMRTTAFRTGSYAGMDPPTWGPRITKKFAGHTSFRNDHGDTVRKDVTCEVTFHEWCQITLWRIVQGHRVSFPGPRVEFEEIFSRIRNDVAVPNERWQKAPVQMHEKTAEAAALRRAFPEELGDEFAAEEAEGMAQRAVDITGEASFTIPPVPAAEPRRTDADPKKPAADATPAQEKQTAGSPAASTSTQSDAGEPGTQSQPEKTDASKSPAAPKDKETRPKREAKAPPTDVQDLNEKPPEGEEPPPATDPQGDAAPPEGAGDDAPEAEPLKFEMYETARAFFDFSDEWLADPKRTPVEAAAWHDFYEAKIKEMQVHKFERIREAIDDTLKLYHKATGQTVG